MVPKGWYIGLLFGIGESTDGWPLCGEIDMMEHVGHTPNEIHMSLIQSQK